jgi:hypothetical protein
MLKGWIGKHISMLEQAPLLRGGVMDDLWAGRDFRDVRRGGARLK